MSDENNTPAPEAAESAVDSSNESLESLAGASNTSYKPELSATDIERQIAEEAETEALNQISEESQEAEATESEEQPEDQSNIDTAASESEVEDAESAREEADEMVEDSDIPEEHKEEAKEEVAKKLYKIKRNGREEEVGEDEMIELAQKGVGAYEKFEEAAKLRKNADQETAKAKEFYKMLKEDLPSLLTHPELGIDKEKVRGELEKYLAGELEEEMLDPKEKELRKYKQELEKLKKEREEQEAKEKELRIQEATKKLAATWEKEIQEALSIENLPKSPRTRQQMIDYMSEAQHIGFDKFTWKDAARKVKSDFVTWQKEIYGSVDEDSIDKVVDPAVLDKVRKAQLKKAKTRVNPSNATRVQEAPKAKPKVANAPSKKPVSDFIEELYRENGID